MTRRTPNRRVGRAAILVATPLALAGGLAAWSSGCAGPRLAPGPALGPDPVLGAFLGPTVAIDADAPSIRAQAARLTADARTDRERAVAIHDFVRDEVKFGWQAAFYESRASAVLAARIGFCNTKSTLFVALLRAAGIPARVRFVDLDAGLLRGIVRPGTPYVDHAFTEVYLDGRWIRTDSSIVDRELFDAAHRRLTAEGRLLGYGIHRHDRVGRHARRLQPVRRRRLEPRLHHPRPRHAQRRLDLLPQRAADVEQARSAHPPAAAHRPAPGQPGGGPDPTGDKRPATARPPATSSRPRSTLTEADAPLAKGFVQTPEGEIRRAGEADPDPPVSSASVEETFFGKLA